MNEKYRGYELSLFILFLILYTTPFFIIIYKFLVVSRYDFSLLIIKNVAKSTIYYK